MGGHYTVIIKNEEYDWIHVDDNSIYKFNEPNSKLYSEYSYILIYSLNN